MVCSTCMDAQSRHGRLHNGYDPRTHGHGAPRFVFVFVFV